MTAVSTDLQGVLTLPRTVVTMTVRGVARQKLIERNTAFNVEAAEAYEAGFRPSHCIHGTRMVWFDDRDAICGWCEESLTLEQEADLMVNEYVSTFMAARDQFDAVLHAAIDSRIEVAVWYPFVSALANRAVDLIAPVWPVEPTRWHPVAGQ